MNEKRSAHSAHSLTHTYQARRTYTRAVEKARALSNPHTLQRNANQTRETKIHLEIGIWIVCLFGRVFLPRSHSLSLFRPIRTLVVASAFYLHFLFLFHFVVFIFSLAVAVAVSGAVLCLLLFHRLILASIIFMMKM